jgi:glyoxylase-like metal-dependent hydrolase (beta-lactamase superfamily II)
MPVATEPKPAELPLPGGRPGASVKVHPILTGEIHAPQAHTDRPSGRLALPKLAGQLVGPRGGWQWLPVPAFLVEHPGAGAVVIDTGLHPSCTSDVAGNMGRIGKLLYHVRMDREQALRSQLPARGVRLEDVRLVIMTHLHIDHASAVSEFPDSSFLVDRREWGAAAEGGTRQGYHSRQFDHAFDWRALDYESDAVESFAGFPRSFDVFGDGSLRVVSTPGHTPGHQSVVLRSRGGEILVVGDAAYTERELRGEAKPLIVHDEHLHRRSLREIAEYRRETPDALVIPGHDRDFWPTLSAVYE